MSYVPVLKKFYTEQVAPELVKSRGYKNKHQVPKLVKINLNTGIDADADKNQIADIARHQEVVAHEAFHRGGAGPVGIPQARGDIALQIEGPAKRTTLAKALGEGPLEEMPIRAVLRQAADRLTIFEADQG